jgi:hypothetical protein
LSLVIDDFLAHPLSRPRFLSREERRRILIRDLFSWTIVALIHLLFFMTLVISLQQNNQRLGRRGAIETMLDLTLLHRNNAPPLTIIKPDVENNRDNDLSAKPLTIIPPVPVIPKIEPAAPAPGDVLNGIGEFLACGASSFEYLNPAQQARCPRQPWQGLQLPNGNIVLLPAPRAIIQQQQQQFTGAEAMNRQMQTNSGCPILLNTPCLQDMFSGDNSRAPGIPSGN